MTPIQLLKQLAFDAQRVKYPSVPEAAITIPKYTDKTANGLTRCVIDFIKLSGYQAERINTMGRPIDRRKEVRDVLGRTRTIGSVEYIRTTGTRGSADVHATIRGRSVKIEVKMQDKQSEAQKQYELSIRSAGGVYWIVRSFDEFYQKYLTLL